MLCEAHKPRAEEEEPDERIMQAQNKICANNNLPSNFSTLLLVVPSVN
jgi:hypothetical protein